MTKLVALIFCGALLGYALHALAQNRVDIRTAVTPLVSSSTSNVSFAWFFDATDRTVYVCRAPSTGDSVECKAKTTLP